MTTKEELDEAIALISYAFVSEHGARKVEVITVALTILTKYRDGELVEVTKGEVDEHLESATPEMLIKIIKAQGANINYWRREFYKATSTWNCSECGVPLISKKNASEPVSELKCHDCWKKEGRHETDGVTDPTN